MSFPVGAHDHHAADPTFEWYTTEPPADLRITQVYGWFFDDHGRVLVQQTPDGSFNLPGGTPELWDADAVATLRREADEESQVDVDRMAWMGFEKMQAPGGEPVAMLRFIGRVQRFRARRPDVDGGRLLRRHLVGLATVNELLAWGDAGRAQAAEAGRLAHQLWALPVSSPSAPNIEVL